MNTKIIAHNISLSISEAVDKNIAEQARCSGKDSSKEINVNQNVASDSNNLTDIQFPPYIIDSTCNCYVNSECTEKGDQHDTLHEDTDLYIKCLKSVNTCITNI